jgi:dipeptidyl-peptidase-4
VKEHSSAQQIMRNDPKTGKKDVMLSWHRLVPLPSSSSSPLRIDDYAWSPDGRFLLIFTNSRRLWRYRTLGEYWLIDLRDQNSHPRQIGFPNDPAGKNASLMYATFSPTSSHIAFVCERDLYVVTLSDALSDPSVPLPVTRLTTTGSLMIANGQGDWVYEEELSLYCGFRWSPDGCHLAYWEIDSSGSL